MLVKPKSPNCYLSLICVLFGAILFCYLFVNIIRLLLRIVCHLLIIWHLNKIPLNTLYVNIWVCLAINIRIILNRIRVQWLPIKLTHILPLLLMSSAKKGIIWLTRYLIRHDPQLLFQKTLNLINLTVFNKVHKIIFLCNVGSWWSSR